MIRIIIGDVRERLRELADESVHMVCTSPPYFGLREYLPGGHADKGSEIGVETTPETYVAALVAVFRDVRRVLRKDGTLWLNLGDSYASAWVCNRRSVVGAGSLPDGKRANRPNRLVDGLKEKDLIGIPWRVAFALQADGWYLRQDIIWNKSNPMPESVRDRCTKAHEYVFLLTKSGRYHYDAEAIAEETVKGASGSMFDSGKTAIHQLGRSSSRERSENGSRNRRSVWSIVTEPSTLGHFALMPSALAELCIKAGTSERGCCPTCGKGWVRELENYEQPNLKASRGKYVELDESGFHGGQNSRRGTASSFSNNPALRPPARATLGWLPSCSCPVHTPIPMTVLDPFAGAGTTGLVADRLGRDAVLIELNPEYAELARRRIAADKLGPVEAARMRHELKPLDLGPLFADLEPAGLMGRGDGDG